MVIRGDIIKHPVTTLDRWAENTEDDVVRTKFLLWRYGHVLLNDDWVQELLNEHHERIDKSPIQKEALNRAFGKHNIIGAGNEQWEGLHQALLPLFGPKSLKDHFDVLKQTSETHLEAFRSSDSIELHGSYADLTVELISRAIFHDTEQTPVDEFMALRDTIQKWNTKQFLLALDAQLPEYVPTRRKRRIEAERRQLNDALRTILDGNERMTGMINDMEDLSEAKVLDTIKIIMAAGTGTTAASLTFVTYTIVTNDFQEELRDELPEEVTYDYIKSESLLEDLINEALRLYPSVPLILRTNVQPITLGDREFDEGTRFLLPMYSLHRNSRYWDDPLEFRPSRWEEMRPSQASGYMPFGAGPRKCIGEFMAKMNMKVILTKLFRDHHIELHSDELDLERAVALSPTHDVDATITPL
jgi:cytochrome P450